MGNVDLKEQEPRHLFHAAGVVILDHRSNKVLLVRQKKLSVGVEGNIPGMYGLPSGIKKPSQSLERNGVDVTKEETGIEAKPEDLREIPDTNLMPALIRRTNGNVLEILMHAYLHVGTQDIERLEETSTTTTQWVSQEELRQLEKEKKLLPNVRGVVEKARRFKKQLHSSAPISVYRSDSPVPTRDFLHLKENGMQTVLDGGEESVIATFTPLDSAKDLYSYTTEGSHDESESYHSVLRVVPRSPDQSKAPAFPAVDLFYATKCTLVCDFCHGPVPLKRDPEESLTRIIKAIAESSARVVSFCGGEPLMKGKRIIRDASTLQEADKVTVLNTNGELVRKVLAPQLTGNSTSPFTSYGISVEGQNEEKHHAMRGEEAQFGETVWAINWANNQPGASTKLATVFSRVHYGGELEQALEQAEAMGEFVRGLSPDVWRLYQYNRSGPYNRGQERHTLDEDTFNITSGRAAEVASPVRTARSNEMSTQGCLIVDLFGNVLIPGQQDQEDFRKVGNLLLKPLDVIWAEIPTSASDNIRNNKSWHRVLPLTSR